jgi:hypothetical protein
MSETSGQNNWAVDLLDAGLMFSEQAGEEGEVLGHMYIVRPLEPAFPAEGCRGHAFLLGGLCRDVVVESGASELLLNCF